jgi:hypothetical protein
MGKRRYSGMISGGASLLLRQCVSVSETPRLSLAEKWDCTSSGRVSALINSSKANISKGAVFHEHSGKECLADDHNHPARFEAD